MDKQLRNLFTISIWTRSLGFPSIPLPASLPPEALLYIVQILWLPILLLLASWLLYLVLLSPLFPLPFHLPFPHVAQLSYVMSTLDSPRCRCIYAFSIIYIKVCLPQKLGVIISFSFLFISFFIQYLL